MFKNSFKLLFSLLVIAIVSGCSPVMELKATSTQWKTGQELWQFKRVKTGKIGEVTIYGNRWRKIDTFYTTGADKEPIETSHFDCIKAEPANPERGDEYCKNTETTYYLVFEGYNPVEVTREVWSEHSPNKVYKVQETIFGLVLIPEE